MTEHTDQHLDLCAALALGSIDARDRQALAEHVADGCPECERALRDFEQATMLLAASAESVMPNPAVRDRVLAAAAAEPRESRAPRTGAPVSGGRIVELPRRIAPEIPPSRWMAIAAALALTTVLAGGYGVWQALEAQRMRTTVQADNSVITGLNAQLEQERRWYEVLSSPDARTATLTATPQAQVVLRARATYDPRSQRAVFVFDNLQAPPGKVFELWAILGAKPASLGLIQTDAEGRAVIKLEHVGDPNQLAAFAVSLENPGGSPNPNAPQGPVIMLGKVEG